jgi:hypothetical protein
LRVPHASIPHNPLISEPLFLAHYVERAGTGTLDMIALCREAGLAEPEFRQEGGQFVQTIWRDWLTTDVLSALRLNERQKKAMVASRQERRTTNSGYQELTGARSRDRHARSGVPGEQGASNTGRRRERGILRGAPEAAHKRLMNGSNGSSDVQVRTISGPLSLPFYSATTTHISPQGFPATEVGERSAGCTLGAAKARSQRRPTAGADSPQGDFAPSQP